MLSKSWKRGFEVANAASIHSDGARPGEKMGAALFSGARLLAIGFNIWDKSNPDSRHVRFDRNSHAEHIALIKRRHYDNANNLVMYVFRQKMAVDKVTILNACSKPCNNCQYLMKLAGVRRVRFFDENGEPAEMKI
jgi:deoxycytidylate deaminase